MTEQHPQPTTWRLFTTWASIGLQSFGGGASTLFLIQRAFIERYGWVSDAEFLRLWNLSQLTPGITLIALAALLGQKLGGVRGIVVSLLGMLAPSGAITCLLAALFVEVERSATTQAVLRGVIPATAGVMALVLYNVARPLAGDIRKSGTGRITLSLALILISAVLVIAFNVSAIVVMVGCGVLGAFAFAPRKPAADEPAAIQPMEETPR